MLVKISEKTVNRVIHYINTEEVDQKCFARRCGLSYATIHNLVNGQLDQLREDTWNRIDGLVGYQFDVQFFGRKLHTGEADKNHKVTVRTSSAESAWNVVNREYDVVRKISCEIIYPPKTKEELEAEKKLLVESFPANIREYVAFFVHSESTEGLKGEVKILKNMVNEMKASIEKFEAYLRQTSPQSL